MYFSIYFLVKAVRKKVDSHNLTKRSKIKCDHSEKTQNQIEYAESCVNSNISTIHSVHSITETVESRKINTLGSTQIKPKSNLNQKMRVLRMQTFIFCVFFWSWFPFIVLTTYEIIMGIKTYDTISKIRNFSVSLIMVNGVVTPILYTYRFKYMRDFFSKIYFCKILFKKK